MALEKSVTKNLITQYQRNTNDTGSSEVQIALLTHDINALQSHFTTNPKDHSSRRGLLRKVHTRRKLLAYVKRTNQKSYEDLLVRLHLRK